MQNQGRPDVLLVGPLPPPSGGMAMQTRQLCDMLRAEGLAVELVQVNSAYQPAIVKHLPAVRALFRLLPYLWILWRASGRNAILHLMANSGWSWHLFAMPAIVIARARGLPIIINYRGGSAPEFLAKQGRWVLPILRLGNVIAVPSGFLARVFREYRLDSVIVPNIVDLTRFMAEARPVAMPGAETRLVVTRNLEAIYDIATALRALAYVRETNANVTMRIAGSGPERERLQAEAEKLGLTKAVKFTGRLDREEMARLYSEADIMLNPSLIDNTPNSILEAWASGVAVISTNVGGVPDLVTEGKNAILTAPGDHRAMGAAVLSLIQNPEKRHLLQKEGEKSARQFCWERIGPQWLDLYSKTV